MILLALSTKTPLKELGANPVQTTADDVPFVETIAFLAEVERVRDAGLGADSLEGICRHRGTTIAADAWTEVVDRVLIALSALPILEPLASGANGFVELLAGPW